MKTLFQRTTALACSFLLTAALLPVPLHAEESKAADKDGNFIQSSLPDNVNPLRGTPSKGEWKQSPIIAVMIDNHPDARAQAGISQADVIFEERVEGDYTRLMAVFQSEAPSLIGPIRSARYNFIERLLEFDGIIARAGGSYEADGYIAANGTKEIDGSLVASDTMWRYNDTGKIAPHNLYTNYETLKKYAAARGYGQNLKAPLFCYDAAKQAESSEGEQKQIHLDYASDNQVDYVYNADDGSYERQNNGDPCLDENSGSPVKIKNIIVQLADSYSYDENGHKAVKQVGEGDAWLFSGGTFTRLHWKKESPEARTVYTLAAKAGTEMNLAPGLTWVNVIEAGGFTPPGA